VGSEAPLVAVAGATGRTGRQIIAELLRRGYRVRALVRDQLKASARAQEGVELVKADLASPASLEHALTGADYLISAIGSRKPFNTQENNRVDNLGNQNLAQAARSAGIRHMVMISSIGVGSSRRALNILFRLLMGPVLRMKEKAEAFLSSCGISYTIIRPGGLSDKDISGEIAFGEGGHITGMVSRAQVARACVDALTHPAMKNRTLEVVAAQTLKEKHRAYVITL